ncbi:MAG: metalloregulator ArsR/SmtB family transcription factor [Pirellulales bacterium]|nr:metalloregulator ArsR/SmtB family transcription factor [Pirellulales bacterium]
MARTPTTTDAFNAIAESRRREIISHLAGQERSVNELVRSLGVSQPQVSKHLRVLREVGVVIVRESGRHRWYRLNAQRLKPVFDWVKPFERFWDHQLAGIKSRAESTASQASDPTSGPRRAPKRKSVPPKKKG